MSVLAAPHRVLSKAQLRRFAAGLAGASERWHGLGELPPGSARCYMELWSDEYVNAWAIRWSDDADTGFHDHCGAAAAIVVVDGWVVEERLSLTGSPIAQRFGPGQCLELPASAIHRVRHGGGAAALTVHAYSPPLLVQGVYRVGAGGALERDTVSYTEELRAGARAVAA